MYWSILPAKPYEAQYCPGRSLSLICKVFMKDKAVTLSHALLKDDQLKSTVNVLHSSPLFLLKGGATCCCTIQLQNPQFSSIQLRSRLQDVRKPRYNWYWRGRGKLARKITYGWESSDYSRTEGPVKFGPTKYQCKWESTTPARKMQVLNTACCNRFIWDHWGNHLPQSSVHTMDHAETITTVNFNISSNTDYTKPCWRLWGYPITGSMGQWSTALLVSNPLA